MAEDLERGQINPRILDKVNNRDLDDEDNPDRKRTKKEIFQDVIRKSKQEKMVRQKGQAEQTEKVQNLDQMFNELFPDLTMANDKSKPKTEQTREYDTLKAGMAFEPIMPPEHKTNPEKEAKNKNQKAKRKQVDRPSDDQDEGSADEEGEEEEYEEYEDDGEDFERVAEKELASRRLREGARGKKEKLEENYNKTVRNLKLLGELEDELMAEFVNGMNDVDMDGDEEGEEEDFRDLEGGDEDEGDEEEGDEEGDIEELEGEEEFDEEENDE